MRLAQPHTILALATLSLVACARRPAPATPAQLRRAIESAPHLEVEVHGVLHESNREALALEVLAQRTGKEVRLIGEGLTGASSVPRIVLGTPADPEIVRLFELLGGSFDPQPTLGSLKLRRKSDRLVVCGEDPDRPGLPLTLHLAAQPGLFAHLLEDLEPRFRPGAALVQVEGATMRDRAADHFHRGPVLEPLARGRFTRLLGDPDLDPERWASYLDRADAAVERVVAWAETRPGYALELQACSSSAGLRALGGRTGLALDDGLTRLRRVLLAPGVPDDGGACAARWAAQAVLGMPAEHWMLDGAAVAAAGTWWGQPLDAWCGQLAAAGLLPGVETLREASSVDHLSQHLVAPARGLLWRFVLETEGSAAARELWTGERAVELDDEAFRTFALARGSGPRPDRRGGFLGEPFRVGVALDSSCAPGGSYDEASVETSLRGAGQLGVSAVSVTATGCALPAPRALAGGRVPLGVEVMEGDAAVAQAVAGARAAGMRRVLLQTQVLSSPTAGHLAWMRRTSTDHWDEFFAAYRPALMHQALLAELLGVDVLCVGTALSNEVANGGLVVDTKVHHDRLWAEAIAEVRGVFGGALTYAARGGGEATNCAHWPHLDLVGASFFPDFGKRGGHTPGEAELERNWTSFLNRLEEVAREEGKPAIIVEVGVRSTGGALGETRLGPGELDLGVQAAAWRALAAAVTARLEASGEPWLLGLVAWKWSASPSGAGSDDRGFGLNGKPAARSLRTLAEQDG